MLFNISKNSFRDTIRLLNSVDLHHAQQKRVPTSSGIMENLENHKKGPLMEKSWNLKNLKNHGKIMEFCEII